MSDKDSKGVGWFGDSPGGNYTAKVMELAKQAGVGVQDVDIKHDDWCALLSSGKPCNCDPEVTLRKGGNEQQAHVDSSSGQSQSQLTSALKALAESVALRLRATPAADPPARAVFDDGVVYLGRTEVMIEFTNIGTFFVSDVSGQIVVEAVVIKELDRAERRQRHRKLQKLGKKLFGEDIVVHDPKGHSGGPTEPES